MDPLHVTRRDAAADERSAAFPGLLAGSTARPDAGACAISVQAVLLRRKAPPPPGRSRSSGCDPAVTGFAEWVGGGFAEWVGGAQAATIIELSHICQEDGPAYEADSEVEFTGRQEWED